jgi:hypothetical protein
MDKQDDVDPWPDRMTSPGGYKTSLERFAQNDLVLRFYVFKRGQLKISTRAEVLPTR